VNSPIQGYLALPLHSAKGAVILAAGVAAAAGFVWYLFRSPRKTEQELEHDRRELLASTGRITDGSITEAPGKMEELQPQTITEVIVYNYRIAGVTYECAQDVTMLAELVRDIRIDLPVQVRYEPHNPANSIVVSESWSGLRLNADAPRPSTGIHRELSERENSHA
jgi:hypothetical protein